MKFRRIPLLLAAAAMLITGAVKLLADPLTSPAAAGALLGAGLVLLSIWTLEELFKNKDDE